MRLLRYSTALLLVSLVACPAADDSAVVDTTNADSANTSTGMAEDSTTSTTTSTTSTTTTTDPMTTEPATDTGMDTEASGDETSSDTISGQQCGDGIISGSEQCDCGEDFCTPAGLNGNMCAGLTNPLFPDRVYTGGVLDCNMASCQFNFNQCSFCGDTVLNGNEVCELEDDPGPSCQALGMGTSTTPLPCGIDCQWDTTCCETPLPKECM